MRRPDWQDATPLIEIAVLRAVEVTVEGMRRHPWWLIAACLTVGATAGALATRHTTGRTP